MPRALNPQIVAQLAAFARRWRGLLLWRGCCAVMVTLLGGLILLATLDRLVILPDPARWILSGLCYAGALVAGWLKAGKYLLRPLGLHELARRIEQAEPRLREDLLSAVELGETDPRWDSPVFRALLQNDVAGRLQSVRPEALLPRRLIVRWLRTAAGVVIFCAVLLALPGLRFGQLFLRAALPLANLDRVSSNQIRLLSPAADQGSVPQGEAVPITVEVTGPKPRKVFLHVFRDGQPALRLPMALLSSNQFTADLQVAQQPLTFRIRAGDAVTRKFNLASQARPGVVQFEKSFRFPAYTKLPPRTVSEETGDLAALAGTEVTLTLHANQPVTRGELLVEEGASQTVRPLSLTASNRLVAQLTLTNFATYRVRLIARETGFENKFSPQFEIRPLPDLLPSIELTEPRQDVILRPDEVLTLKGRAQDDLGLAKVSQEFRLNNGEWKEATLPLSIAPDGAVERAWDLFELGLRAGDQLTTKLVALDLKGSRSESGALQVLIRAGSFDESRLTALQTRGVAGEFLAELREAARDLERAASEATKGNREGDLQLKQAELNIAAKFEATERTVAAAWNALKNALKEARAGREAGELATAGMGLSQLREDGLSEAKANSVVLRATPATRAELDRFVAPLRRAADLAGTLEASMKELYAAQTADVLLEQIDYFLEEQKRIQRRASKATPTGSWPQLAQRQRGVAAELKLLEQMLENFAALLPKSLADRAKQIRQKLGTERSTLETALQNEIAGDEFQAASARLHQRLQASLGELRPLAIDLSRRADKSRASLQKVAGTSGAILEPLRQAAGSAAGEKSSASKKKMPVSLEGSWSSAITRFKARAEFEEHRAGADHLFVAELGRTAQALTALRAAASGENNPGQLLDQIKTLQKALGAIEAGHQLAEAAGGLGELAAQERWEADSSQSATARPRDWNWLHLLLKSLPETFRSAGMPDAFTKNLRTIVDSPPASEVTREMAGRYPLQRASKPVPEPLEDLLAMLSPLKQEVAAWLKAASESITKAAPSLSEMMTGLAQASQQAEQKTRAAETALKEKEPVAAREEARELLEKQSTLTEQIADLRDALRREANIQDMLNAEGRERARDADDASAMLREPPVKAQELLRDAASPKPSMPLLSSLSEAAQQQHKTTEALEMLARHFQAMEQGGAGERAALRQAEEQLGIKSALDAQYDQTEKMADLAQKSPMEMLAELERELARNEAMRKELSAIAREAMSAAEKALSQAVEDEQKLDSELRTTAKAQEGKANSIAERMETFRADAKRLAGESSDAKAVQKLQEAASQPAPRSPLQPSALAQDASRLAATLGAARDDVAAAAKAAAQEAKSPIASEATTQSAAQMTKLAAETARLAKEAGELAASAQPLKNDSGEQVTRAATAQANINQEVNNASASLGRAERHESRLAAKESVPLREVSEATRALAEQVLPPLQSAVANAASPAAAQPPVQTAQAALEAQLASLQAALEQGQPAGAQKGDPNSESSASPAESKAMARALDQLDASMKNQKPSPDGQNQPGANQPGQRLAQAQQEAQRAERTNNQSQESQGSGADAYYAAKAQAHGALPELPQFDKADWGKLPPQVAQDLMEGQRENVAGEYRRMVETYFRVIAEKAVK